MAAVSGTVQPISDELFNPQEDANTLMEAVKGFGEFSLRSPPRVLISFTYTVRFSLVDRYWLLVAQAKHILPTQTDRQTDGQTHTQTLPKILPLPLTWEVKI